MVGGNPLDYQIYQTDNNVDCIIFLLHGYGSNGKDLITLAPELGEGCKNLMFVSPNALQPFEGGGQGFFQWHSLLDRSYNTIRMLTESTAPKLESFIKQISEQNNIPISKIFILGFSQGAMMALYLSYRLSEEIMGVIGLSGRLNMPDLFAKEVQNKPPALLIHGAEDYVVLPSELQTAREVLKENDVDVESHLRPKLAHGIDAESVKIINKFLRDKLGY